MLGKLDEVFFCGGFNCGVDCLESVELMMDIKKINCGFYIIVERFKKSKFENCVYI